MVYWVLGETQHMIRVALAGRAVRQGRCVAINRPGHAGTVAGPQGRRSQLRAGQTLLSVRRASSVGILRTQLALATVSCLAVTRMAPASRDLLRRLLDHGVGIRRAVARNVVRSRDQRGRAQRARVPAAGGVEGVVGTDVAPVLCSVVLVPRSAQAAR